MTLEQQQWEAFLSAYDNDYADAQAAWQHSKGKPPPATAVVPLTTPRTAFKNEYPSEQELTWAIIKELRARGCLCWHNDAGHTRDTTSAKRGRPPAGFPDIPVYAPNGRHILLEVKQPADGVVSDEQSKFIKAVIALGHRATVVTSVLEAVQAVFSEA